MIDRPMELALGRRFLKDPGPALLRVTGPPRTGKTHLVREVLNGRPSVWVRGTRLPAPLAGPEMLEALQVQIRGLAMAADPDQDDGDGEPWAAPIRLLAEVAESDRPPVVVVDDADPLLRDRRFLRAFQEYWSHLRAHGLRVHVIVLGRDLPEADVVLAPEHRDDSRLGPVRNLEVGYLGLREAAAATPHWGARECVAVYGLVGGIPDFWSRVDPRRRPEGDLSHLVLAPDGPCRDLVSRLLPGPVLGSERAMALIHALARGADRWGRLRTDARIFRTSSELGPYVKTLVDEGLVEARRSLDAAPRSRSRRYRLRHPFVAFWFGAVHGSLPRLDAGAPPGAILEELQEGPVPELVERRLPGIVREYLLHHGHEQFNTPAREVGAAWGEGYDLDVAATLQSGAAVYGHVRWSGAPPSPGTLDRLTAEIRRARYGFGREARLPLLVLRHDPGHQVARRAAQIPGARLLGPTELVGRN